MKTVLPAESSAFDPGMDPERLALMLPDTISAYPIRNPLLPRQLKVYTQFQQRCGHRYLIVPQLRLCGLWLQSLGFEHGQWVTVQPEPGRLVITVNRVEEP